MRRVEKTVRATRALYFGSIGYPSSLSDGGITFLSFWPNIINLRNIKSLTLQGIEQLSEHLKSFFCPLGHTSLLDEIDSKFVSFLPNIINLRNQKTYLARSRTTVKTSEIHGFDHSATSAFLMGEVYLCIIFLKHFNS